MVVFLWRELRPPSSRTWLVLACSCFAAAVGLDFLTGLNATHPFNILFRLDERFYHDFENVNHRVSSFEEFLEMVGITLCWVVFLRHFTTLAGPRLVISMHEKGASGPAA